MTSETELQNLLNFQPEDLAANRLGQFSPRQKQNLKRNFCIQFIAGTIFCLIFVIIGLWLAFTQREIFIGAVFIALGTFLLISLWLITAVSVDDLHVQRVSGYLSKEIKDGDNLSYHLIMGNVRMTVAKSLFEAFNTGDAYIFYYYQRKNWLSEPPQPIAVEQAENFSGLSLPKNKA